MRIGFAQLNPTVGDLAGNTRKILAAYETLCAQGAELVLTPELAICGYPPQDLVFKSRFVPLNLERLAELHAAVGGVPLLVGYVEVTDAPGQPFRNAVALLQRGQPVQRVFKSLLPTYDVFDEDRYFEPASTVAVLELKGRKIGVTICEDIWTSRYLPRRLYGFEPVAALMEKGAELILNLSASPFATGKLARRIEMLSGLATQHRVPIAYCNVVGGNDQLIFDGNSLAIGRDGRLLARLASFQEDLAVIDLDAAPREVAPLPSEPQEVHDALVLGLRD